MVKKKFKKYYKWVVVSLVIITVLVLTILIYKNLFQDTVSERLESVDKYKVTKKEINIVKESLNELVDVSDIDIYTNYKIIKIFINLQEDIKFDDINEALDESINNFNEENLKFYDIEVFIDCEDEESKIYPKIGYKHKTNSEFTWNR